MPQPSGLGRGLGSLIPTKKLSTNFVTDAKLSEVMESERISQLPVEKISPNPHQPRQNFGAESLSGLAESIREHGILQPLIVTKKDFDGYELVAGERRLKAAKMAGFKTVPAVIRALNDQKKMELALVENLQRQDLNPLEMAMAYKKLIDEFNFSPEEVARKIGRSVSFVTNYVRLLDLRDEVKEAIAAGKLTEGHARTLVDLPYDDQLVAMKKIVEGKFTVREAERQRREITDRKKLRPTKFDPEVHAIENDLSAALGTKVEIRRHGGVGQITIKFFSNEELRRIVEEIS